MRCVSIAIGLAFALSLTAHATEPPAGTNPVYSNTLSPEAIMALGDECIDLLDRDETSDWNVQLARKCSRQLNAVLELRKKTLKITHSLTTVNSPRADITALRYKRVKIGQNLEQYYPEEFF